VRTHKKDKKLFFCFCAQGKVRHQQNTPLSRQRDSSPLLLTAVLLGAVGAGRPPLSPARRAHSSNPPRAAAAVDRLDRETDGRTDGHRAVT